MVSEPYLLGMLCISIVKNNTNQHMCVIINRFIVYLSMLDQMRLDFRTLRKCGLLNLFRFHNMITGINHIICVW